MPFPLTLDSAFAYFFYSLIGAIDRGTIISYDWLSKENSKSGHEHRASENILVLYDQHLFEKMFDITSVLPSLSIEEKMQLVRLLRFTEMLCGRTHLKLEFNWNRMKRDHALLCMTLFEGTKPVGVDAQALRKREDVVKLLKYFLVRDVSPDVILRPIFECFMRIIVQRIDPFEAEISMPDFPVSSNLPERKEGLGDPSRKLATVAFDGGHWSAAVSNSKLLANEHIALIIAGPSGSGKSTLLSSLFLALRETMQEMEVSDPSSVELLDVDWGSRTISSILAGEGRDTGYLRLLKRPWTTQMAHMASHALLSAKQRRTIVLADLPGKAPDEIFRIIGASGDLAIVISDRSEEISRWTKALADIGVQVVAEIHSLKDESLPPEATSITFESKSYIRAEYIVLPGRKKGVTPFVKRLAQWLLFVRFPRFIEWQESCIREALQ